MIVYEILTYWDFSYRLLFIDVLIWFVDLFKRRIFKGIFPIDLIRLYVLIFISI